MHTNTAITIILVFMFIFIGFIVYFDYKSKAACYAVADTQAKLTICKGTTYKEQL